MHAPQRDGHNRSRIGDKRALLLSVRQALIIALGAIEDYLNMERSIIPKHRRAKR
jgi:hypothetical protein